MNRTAGMVRRLESAVAHRLAAVAGRLERGANGGLPGAPDPRKLIYVYGDDKLRYAYVAVADEDTGLINEAVRFIGRRMPVVCEDPTLSGRLDGSLVEIIGYDDIANRKIPIVVLPTGEHEAQTVANLHRVWKKHLHRFNVFDAYQASYVCAVPTTRTYRGVELSLQPSVLFPTLYSNWDYVNYLVDVVIRDRKLDVLDMFAGSGVIGFCLRDETPIKSIAFADANFWAVRSIRETAAQNPRIAGTAWLSEGLRGVPAEARFDLIVGNPPHADLQLSGPSMLPGSDPAWQAHHMFFADAYRHLKPGGRINFIESWPSGIDEAFYRRHIGTTYPQYRLAESPRMDNHICYTQEVVLV